MADHDAKVAEVEQVDSRIDSHAAAPKPRRKPALLREADVLPKLFWTVAETAFMCRAGARTVWRELSNPKSKFPRARRILGRTLLSRDEVLAFLAEGAQR